MRIWSILDWCWNASTSPRNIGERHEKDDCYPGIWTDKKYTFDQHIIFTAADIAAIDGCQFTLIFVINIPSLSVAELP